MERAISSVRNRSGVPMNYKYLPAPGLFSGVRFDMGLQNNPAPFGFVRVCP